MIIMLSLDLACDAFNDNNVESLYDERQKNSFMAMMFYLAFSRIPGTSYSEYRCC